MKISVVVTTYNWKEALGLCLKSIFAQTRLPEEIIVADDGSREDTAELVRAHSAASPVPLIHMWQPDEGFQAAKARNRGIAAASGNYIVLLDGDMLVNRFFIEDHHRLAKPNTFLQGKRACLSPAATRRILESGTIRIGPFMRGVATWWHRRYLLHSRCLSAIYSATDRQMRGILSSNMACWRSDALRINGFDERFVGYGYEDADFAQRLLHAGLQRQYLKHLICAAHLYHPCRAGAAEAINKGIVQECQESRAIRCEQGIDSYLPTRAGENDCSESARGARVAAA